MIEGYVHIQKVTSYSTSWRNCWIRVDDKSIHLFYRPNCPPKGVRANKVVPRANCISVTVNSTADPTLQIDVSQGDPIVVKCDDLELLTSIAEVIRGGTSSCPQGVSKPVGTASVQSAKASATPASHERTYKPVSPVAQKAANELNQKKPVSGLNQKPVTASYQNKPVAAAPSQERPANSTPRQDKPSYQQKPVNPPSQEPTAIHSAPPRRSPPSTAPPADRKSVV